MATRVWNAYLRTLNKWPTRTQMVQTCIIMGTGDAVSQLLVEGRRPFGLRGKTGGGGKAVYDPTRTARFAVVGFVVVAPMIRVWYSVLERTVNPLKLPAVAATVAKVGLDQTLFAPPFGACIISALGVTQGLSFSQIKDKLGHEWWDVLKANWMFWPFVQLVNFYLTPLLVRPLVVGIASLFWNTYFAWKSNKTTDYGKLE